MLRLTCLLALTAVLTLSAAPVVPGDITGQYVEVRNCDVWTGPCFANAEGNLTGQYGAMVWRVEKGTVDNVNIDGLTVVAVVQASDTLGANQTGPAKAIVIVDSRANDAQRAALVKLARQQGGDLVANVIETRTATIKASICDCEGHGCADVDAGIIKITTRCLDEKFDKHCGNEYAYYPPLTRGVDCHPAVAEHSFDGDGLAATWHEKERRGAYVGTFVAH